MLVDSICVATEAASNEIRRIYSDDNHLDRAVYPRIGDVELYIHGGGFSGVWSIGVLQVLHALEETSALKIHTLHGYSIGAIFAVFYACNLTTRQIIDAYTKIQQTREGNTGLYCVCRSVLMETLPENAHELCEGRVRIGMTQKFPLWYREESTFPTRLALIDAVVHSAAVPCITTTLSDSFYNYVDGMFGHTVWGWSPPRLGRTGIELLPPVLGYSYIFSPTDPYIYGLIMNGLTDVVYFLQKKPTKFIRTLSYMPWHVGIITRFVDRMHWSMLQRVT